MVGMLYRAEVMAIGKIVMVGDCFEIWRILVRLASGLLK